MHPNIWMVLSRAWGAWIMGRGVLAQKWLRTTAVEHSVCITPQDYNVLLWKWTVVFWKWNSFKSGYSFIMSEPGNFHSLRYKCTSMPYDILQIKMSFPSDRGSTDLKTICELGRYCTAVWHLCVYFPGAWLCKQVLNHWIGLWGRAQYSWQAEAGIMAYLLPSPSLL